MLIFQFLKKTYLTEELTKIMSDDELQKFGQIFTSDFKPGNLDITAIKNSIYFFS